MSPAIKKTVNIDALDTAFKVREALREELERRINSVSRNEKKLGDRIHEARFAKAYRKQLDGIFNAARAYLAWSIVHFHADKTCHDDFMKACREILAETKPGYFAAIKARNIPELTRISDALWDAVYLKTGPYVDIENPWVKLQEYPPAIAVLERRDWTR